MGSSYSVYCGPAAVCKPGITKVKKTNELVCQQCSPIKDFTGISPSKIKRFCPGCGSQLVDITFMSDERQSPYEVTEAMDDALALGNYNQENGDHIFIPNARRTNHPRNFSFNSHEDNVIQSLMPHEVSSEIAWFRQAYAPELAILSDLYGSDNINVKFVMFGAWH